MKNDDIDEVIDRAIRIYEDAMHLPKPDLSQVDLSRGFQSSKNACSQEQQVYMTPIMKNMIKQKDHVPEGWKLTVNAPPTKAEEWLKKEVNDRLMKQFGDVKTYDIHEPLDSIRHYGTDCWHNFNENMRQIQPGQYEERLKIAAEFGTRMDPAPIFKIMREDPLMRLSIRRMMQLLPHVRADSDFTETSAPFETKHTNVGYKWWFNDRVIAEDGKTYGQICLETAKKLTPSELKNWNVCTAFGRNQRGKGRLLIAMSRVVNLWFNRLEAREIELYKSVPYFIGYRDEHDLKEAMIKMLEYAIANDLVAYNWDQSGFDRHINPAWLALIGAISENAADNALGKRIAYLRAVYGLHSWLVNGMTGKVEEIFGRMFSGFIDTNAGDSKVEGIVFPWALMSLDRLWTQYVSKTLYYMFGQGDDFISLIRASAYDPNKLVKLMEKIGFELNDKKSAFGIFFLQYRLFRLDGKYIMVYPWTRVLRSMCFTEKSRGLGRFGWLLSQYQQLNKLIEYPPALDQVVGILLPFDELAFGADYTVEQILQGIKEEDAKAKQESAGTQYRSTAEKLFDGDPSKQAQFNEDMSVNSSYLELVHEAVKQSVLRCRKASQPKTA